MTKKKKNILPWLVVGGLGLFVVFMLQFLIRGMNQNLNLVGDDYYDKAQQYDQQMGVNKNTLTDAETLEVIFDENIAVVEVLIPNEIKNYKGKLKFYRPSNATMDFELEVKKGQHKFNVSHVNKGLWYLQLTLHLDEKTYYKEKQIIIK